MDLLLISNSFGVNLQTYVKQIAEFNQFDLDIYTLYIGGCSLDMHMKNIDENNKTYELYHNGISTKEMTSIKDVIVKRNWDIISLQQASHYSGSIEYYYPHFANLFNYIKCIAPNAKIAFHQTWAYSGLNPFKYEDTPKYVPDFKFKNEKEMKKGIDFCLRKILKDYKIDIVFRSGDVIKKGCKYFGDCYDAAGFHLNNLGCYLIGLALVKTLMGKKIRNVFVPEYFAKSLCEKTTNFINKYF